MNKIIIEKDERERIVHLYTIRNQTIEEIAEEFPFSFRVVRRVLHEENIPMRKRTQRPEKRKKLRTIWEYPEKVVRLYQEEKLSLRAIAKKFNVSIIPVIEILNVFQIERRTLSEARRLRDDKYGSVDIQSRVVELRQENLKIQEIAEKVGRSPVEILEILRDANAVASPGQNTFYQRST